MSGIRESARHWARVWELGWNDHWVEPIVALYAPDATCVIEPFTSTYRGTDQIEGWLRRVFAEESDVTAHFGEPIADDGRAAIRWWTTLREDDAETTLAGTSIIRVDRSGLVVLQVDAWNRMSGQTSLPDHWDKV